ncbi:MAG TPA: carboxypeptidase regulatory-like domain-containing protein, partial [Chitinophagaceae bacterium]|nr:carboxypeptidase regulatory-like domain-containing protein [Chitinophagaceae bacterium]
MLIRSITLIVCILAGLFVQAQNLKLTGKVSNQKNEPLIGASVKITSGGGTTTDLEGRFSLSLAEGAVTEIQISAVGYGTKTISDVTVKSGQANELDVILEIAAKDLSGVTVTSTRSSARRETVASVIQFQKNTNTVASVVSAESIRRSPDRNTGEVLKRIPGTSIQDGKYIIVRGLADRYNQAMLNGVLLSSTEPDRKTFSFDLFPAQMIDNIIINKAFVPELPGEWAGGLIQVNTKDIPSVGFFNMQVGTGFNTQTIGKDFYTYKGGKYDWLGFDDKSRGIPSSFPTKNKWGSVLVSDADKTNLGKQLPNIWTAQAGTAPLNASFQINGGFNTRFLGKKVGGIVSVNYNRSNRNLDFNNASYNITGGKADYSFDYHNNRYSQDVLWGALGNITVQLNSNNKISFKNLFNVNASDYTTLRTGRDYELDAVRGEKVRATELAFRSNIYYNTQLIGEHNFAGLGVRGKWYGGFTILDQYIPDQRRIQYNQKQNVAGAPYILLASDVLSQKSGSRFFSSLNDYVYNAGGDLSKTFTAFDFKQTVKGGYMLQVRDRLFDSRPFSNYLERNDDSHLDVVTRDASTIFSPENFDAADPYKFQFDE